MMRFTVCSLLVAVSAIGCSDPTSPDRHVELRTDADVYQMGEEVQVVLVNHRAPFSDRIWHFPCQVPVAHQDGDGWELVGVVGNLSCLLYYAPLEPGESHELSVTIDRYRTRGGGEASFEPGKTYRFIQSVRDWTGEGERWTGIYSSPFVVQD